MVPLLVCLVITVIGTLADVTRPSSLTSTAIHATARQTDQRSHHTQTTATARQTAQTSHHTPATAPPSGYRRVCFPDVGCFDNKAPFDYAHLDLPRSPKDVGTTFLLYTRTAPVNNDTVILDYVSNRSLKESTFRPEQPTKFIIHGFTNTINTTWLYQIKDALLKKGDFNVVVVVWGPGAKFPDYNQAVANTRMVATQTKMLLDLMVGEGCRDEDMHLIGHSLGAHTSGYVGYLMSFENRTLGRITGLDPAEPDYEFHPKPVRLDKKDASFVDVIHSNGAKVWSGGAGLMQPSGHMDFFLNGGESQPDCPNQITAAISNLFGGKFSQLGDVVSCSHSRSHEVFLESINSPCPFTAYPCESYDKFQRGECLSCGPMGCAEMGYFSDYYLAQGKMYLNTRLSSPFCGYHYGFKVTSSSHGRDTTGELQVKLHGLWGDTEWIQVTKGHSDALTKRGPLSRVMVSEKEVGKIQTIDVKYVRAYGGQDRWHAGEIMIESGETGKRFLFCLSRDLISNHIVTIAKATSETC